jgi:hypothetical protein
LQNFDEVRFETEKPRFEEPRFETEKKGEKKV